MDVLSDILSHLRLRGALYFRTAFTPPWGVQVPAFQNVARFHLAHRGNCWFSVVGEREQRLLRQGELLIVPHGAAHILRDTPETRVLSLDQMVEAAGFTGEGALVFGGDAPDSETQLVCGHLAFDADADHPLLGALPPFLHIRNADALSNMWLEITLKLLGSEAGTAGLGSDLIALHLAEVVFAQAIRVFLATDGRDLPVLKGLADPAMSRLLAAFHHDPQRPWTLDTLASEAGMSRTAFATRFRELMGMTPMSYVTHWRMQMARQLLAESRMPILTVAERSGYHSEAAFGRVFKRHFAIAPAAYRRAQRAHAAAAPG